MADSNLDAAPDERPTIDEQIHVAIDVLLRDVRVIVRLAVEMLAERLAGVERRDLNRYLVIAQKLDRLVNDQEDTNRSVAAKLHQLANHAMGVEAKIDEVSEFATMNDETMQQLLEIVIPLLNSANVKPDAGSDERST